MIVKLFLTLLTVALALGPTGDGELSEDFEGAVPEGWERVSSDTHPPYNTAELVREPKEAKSGRQFVRFTTQGGSTSLRRSFRRAWPVDAGRPYRLSAWARLNGTRRNSASVALTWLNASGAVVAEHRTSKVTRLGEWTELVLEVPRAPEQAAAVAPRLDFEGDDIRGTCDFDAVTLAAVERIEIRAAGRDHAVFSVGEVLRFDLTLAGLPPGIHGLTLVLTSPGGQDVRRTATVTSPADRPTHIEFPAAAPGVHTLTASVDARSTRRSLTVLVPNPRISPPRAGDPELPPGPLGEALRGETADSEGHPTPLLLARLAAADLLADALPMAEAPVFPEPVRAAAFRHGDTARLALWTRSGTVDLPLAFNEGARLYPPLGVIRPLRPGERISVGPLPVFILDIDPLLLESRVQLSNADLPLQIGAATRTLRFRNPSRTQMLRDVRLRLVDLPAGWRVTPRSLAAPTLAPAADLSEDLQFSIPTSETEREQDLRVEVAYTRNGRETLTHVSFRVRLVSSIGIETVVEAGPKPDSRQLRVRVVNRTEHPMTLALRSRLPNLAEQTELIRDLGPGSRSAAFEYVVKDAHLVDPLRLVAELSVQESGGDRACARSSVPLR